MVVLMIIYLGGQLHQEVNSRVIYSRMGMSLAGMAAGSFTR